MRCIPHNFRLPKNESLSLIFTKQMISNVVLTELKDIDDIAGL